MTSIVATRPSRSSTRAAASRICAGRSAGARAARRRFVGVGLLITPTAYLPLLTTDQQSVSLSTDRRSVDKVDAWAPSSEGWTASGIAAVPSHHGPVGRGSTALAHACSCREALAHGTASSVELQTPQAPRRAVDS